MIAYLNGRYLPRSDVRIDPDDRGFLLGDGVYEVVRLYAGRPYALADHRARLERSLAEVQIGWPLSSSLAEICRRLVEANDLSEREGLVYLQVTRGVAHRQHPFPAPGTPPTAYATAWPIDPPAAMWRDGIHAILAPDIRWARCDIKAIGLLPNVMTSQRAREQGAGEAIFVRDGLVTEGTHTNVAAVFGGTLVTHPKSHHILPGVTRDVVLRLAAHLGIPIREEPVPVADLRRADEIMVLGTTKEVTAVVAIDEWSVGSGEPGPVARRLHEAFRQSLRSEWPAAGSQSS